MTPTKKILLRRAHQTKQFQKVKPWGSLAKMTVSRVSGRKVYLFPLKMWFSLLLYVGCRCTGYVVTHISDVRTAQKSMSKQKCPIACGIFSITLFLPWWVITLKKTEGREKPHIQPLLASPPLKEEQHPYTQAHSHARACTHTQSFLGHLTKPAPNFHLFSNAFTL